MNERISPNQLSNSVRRARRTQVILSVGGMGFFVLALIGGAVQSVWLSWLGIIGFVVCLFALLIVGAGIWLRSPR
jgi:hypothetical protein